MTAVSRIIVVEIDALLPAGAETDAASHALPVGALETLSRAQHAGARIYLLTAPLGRSDGVGLDPLLARCEHIGRQLQETGSRLDGALVPEAGDAPEARAVAALQDLCGRLQCDPASLELVACSAPVRDIAGAVGAGRVHDATGGAFPDLSPG